MKKFITISLFIFWAITVAVITAGLISFNKNRFPVESNINSNANQPSDNTASAASANITKTSSGLSLTMAELAKHDSANSCWLLISGKIYDVTTFINQHPGNANTILPFCGTDATSAYNTKGSESKPHSANANSILADYYIGNLNQTVATSPTNPANPPVANPNPITPLRSGDDDD